MDLTVTARKDIYPEVTIYKKGRKQYVKCQILCGRRQQEVHAAKESNLQATIYLFVEVRTCSLDHGFCTPAGVRKHACVEANFRVSSSCIFKKERTQSAANFWLLLKSDLFQYVDLNWQKSGFVWVLFFKWLCPANSKKLCLKKEKKKQCKSRSKPLSYPKLEKSCKILLEIDQPECRPARLSNVELEYNFFFSTQCHNNLVINHLDIPLCRFRSHVCQYFYFILLLGTNVFMHWCLKGKKKNPPCRSFLVSWTKRQLFYAL